MKTRAAWFGDLYFYTRRPRRGKTDRILHGHRAPSPVQGTKNTYLGLLIYDAARGIHRPVKCLDNFEEISRPFASPPFRWYHFHPPRILADSLKREVERIFRLRGGAALREREKTRGGDEFYLHAGEGGGAKQLRFAVENSARLERCSKRVSFFFFFLFERGKDEFYIYTRGRSKSWNLYKRDSIPPRRVVEEDEEIARKWEEVQVVYPCVYSSSRLINKRIFWIYESFKFHLPHSSFYKQIFNSRFRSSTRFHVDYY